MTPAEASEAERYVGGPSAGVHHAPATVSATRLQPALEASGRAAFSIDLGDAASKAAILEAFATGLAFPAWVGRNWDALDDALRDLSWLPSGPNGRAFIVLGAGRAASSAAAELEVLQDVLRSAADDWAETDDPLVIVQMR